MPDLKDPSDPCRTCGGTGRLVDVEYRPQRAEVGRTCWVCNGDGTRTIKLVEKKDG